VFVLALIIVSIVTAAKNSRSDAVGGKAAAFTGAQRSLLASNWIAAHMRMSNALQLLALCSTFVCYKCK
jgi:hypothetical protein